MKRALVAVVVSFGIVVAAPASQPSQAALQKEAKISMEKARAIALEKVPHGKVKSGELERENGRLIYSFDIRDSKGTTEVNVDAKNGEVIEAKLESPEEEAAEKKAEQAELQKEAKISMEKARAIALQRVPQGTIVESELEREHGKLIYSFEIRGSSGITEVNVDAKDGPVISVEHESVELKQ